MDHIILGDKNINLVKALVEYHEIEFVSRAFDEYYRINVDLLKSQLHKWVYIMEKTFNRCVFLWLALYAVNIIIFKKNYYFYLFFHICISTYLIYSISLYRINKNNFNIRIFLFMVVICMFFIITFVDKESLMYFMSVLFYPFMVVLSSAIYICIRKIDFIYGIIKLTLYCICYVFCFYYPCYRSKERKLNKKYLFPIFLLLIVNMLYTKR